MSNHVTALEAQLQEKQELVTALTERLEQAAEQLDRVHRTGADRGVRSGAGFPPELIDEHKSLVDDLQHAVQQWGDMQAEATLGRLEIQLTEMRDLMVGNLAPGSFAGQPSRNVQNSTQEDDAQESAEELHTKLSSSDDDKPSDYESLKASLLQEDQTSEDELASEDERASEDDVEAKTENDDRDESEEALPVDPPPPIDIGTAAVEALQQAVESRDAYISYLIQKLRRVESTSSRVPDDWEALESVPEELRCRLEEIGERLEETLRLAEVEHSLERARLGREQARLQEMDQQLQKEFKRVGLKTEADQQEAGENEGDSNKSGISSRWERLFGKRWEDSSDDADNQA
jgi:hypothetical protein